MPSILSPSSGGSSGGGGLWATTMGAVPTAAGTGLTTWANQPAGATRTDAPNGLVIYCPSQGSVDNSAHLVTPVPASVPYTITACAAVQSGGMNQNNCLLFGFADGSGSGAKREMWVVRSYNTASDSFGILRLTGSQPNTGAAWSAGPSYLYTVPSPIWLRFVVTSTTVSYQFSSSGDMWATYYTVTKAGSFMGSSGYAYLNFGLGAYNGDSSAQLMSWSIT